MLEVITDYGEIQETQRQFERAFDNLWDKVVHGYVSYQGERQKAILSWSSELGLWASIGKVEFKELFWRVFHLHKYDLHTLTSFSLAIVPFKYLAEVKRCNSITPMYIVSLRPQ